MKKILLLVLGSSFILMSFAELEGSDKIYRYLEDKHNAFSMSLSKEMTDFFDMDIDFNGKEKWITGDFKKGKLLFSKNFRDSGPIKKMFQEEGYEYINLEDQDDTGKGKVYLFVRRKGQIALEAHFVIEEDEQLILLSIFGQMKVQGK